MLPRPVPLCRLMCLHSAVTRSYAGAYAFACVYFTLTRLVERDNRMKKKKEKGLFRIHLSSREKGTDIGAAALLNTISNCYAFI